MDRRGHASNPLLFDTIFSTESKVFYLTLSVFPYSGMVMFATIPPETCVKTLHQNIPILMIVMPTPNPNPNMLEMILAAVAAALATGVAAYFYLRSHVSRGIQTEQDEKFRLLVEEMKKKDEANIRRLEESTRRLDENTRRLETDKKDLQDRQKKLDEVQKKLDETESKLAQKEDRIDRKSDELDRRVGELDVKETMLEREREEITRLRSELEHRLSEIARLSQDEAREILLRETEAHYEKDILGLIEKKKVDMRARERELSREILVNAIQQYAGEVTTEMTQTIIHIENDDLKGKIIGKEGRNIIAFEKATGVSIIIDDTPDTVFISSYDLFRRFIAKKTLEDLILDKRIQPARIEEIAEKNAKEAEKLIFELGEKTLAEMGIAGIPAEIVPLIGKFRFRTSYGQNILMHAKEVAYIAEAIAKQIGADAELALKGGLLHDLGKSMDHDVEGTHPEIGGRIARKYGLHPKIVNIIEGHHDDVPAICIETKIIQIADAISAIRPGARRMNADQYIKRIQEIENLAMSFTGVNKAYALSAGREIRVFVDAAVVNDLQAEKLAQEIAANIEANLNYPGEIRITLIREKRVIEYAR